MSDVKIRKLTARDIDAVMKIDEKISGKPQEAYWAGKIVSYLSREPEACLAAEIDNKVWPLYNEQLLKLAEKGINALKEDKGLAKGLNTHEGSIANKTVADALGLMDKFRSF